MSLNLAAMMTIGAVLTSTFVPNTNRAKGLIGSIGTKVEELQKRNKKLGETVKRLSNDQSAANMKAVAESKARIGLINRRIAALREEQKIVQRAGESFERGTQRMKRSVLHVGAAVGAVNGIIGKPVRAAMAHESGMLGVVKQMDGLRDEKTKQLTEAYYSMEEGIWKLSEQLPIANNKIIGMVEQAGQMGIKGEDKALPFVFSVGKTAIALELDAEKAAEDMAKLSSIMQIPAEQIESRLMDHINFLSDNSPAKGGQLIEVLKGMGGTAQFVGMDERDSAALASLLMSVSSTQEIARTAGNALIRELAVAQSQPKRFHDGMKALGLSSKDVQTDMAKDAAGTIVMVLKKIRDLPAHLRSTVTTQLFGKEYGDDVSKVALNVEKLEDLREKVRSAAVKDSIQREFEAKEKSLEYKLIRMNNQLERLWVNLGQAFIDPVGELVSVLSDWGKKVALFAKENRVAFTSLFYGLAGLVAGGIVAKVIMFFAGLGQAIWSMGKIAHKTAALLRDKALGLGSLEYEEREARNRRKGRRSARRRFVQGRAAGRPIGRLGRFIGRVVTGASLRLWRAGTRVLGLLASSLKGVGNVARLAGRWIGSVFRVLGNGIRAVFGFLKAHPFVAALTLLGTAITMIHERWSSFQWFFSDISERMAEFRGVMTEVKKDVLGAIEAVGEFADLGYGKARSWTSDMIEKGVNWWKGTEPVRADAPVMTRKEREALDAAAVPPVPSTPLPVVSPRGANVVNHHDNSTVSINITQQPGEDGAALARRTAQEIERAKQVRVRGAMYDLVPGF